MGLGREPRRQGPAHEPRAATTHGRVLFLIHNFALGFFFPLYGYSRAQTTAETRQTGDRPHATVKARAVASACSSLLRPPLSS